jgi:hypothetical protein
MGASFVRSFMRGCEDTRHLDLVPNRKRGCCSLLPDLEPGPVNSGWHLPARGRAAG